MNKLILILCAIISLSACNDFVEHDIPQDQISIYNSNDTVIFRDNINDRNDTFGLDISNTFWKSDHSTTQHYSVSYNLLKNKTKKYFMSTAQDYKSISVLFGNSNFSGIGATTITNYSQAGITYPSVFYSHLTYIIPDTMPNSVYFTYKYGVLRFEYKDGRIYELIRN